METRPSTYGVSHYIHGNNPEEQARLSLLNSLLNDAEMREMGIRAGDRILERGSGLGQFARAMARDAGPSGRVVGIERDKQQIAEAERKARAAGEADLVEVRAGDAMAPPLRDDEWGTFDVAHARFLLEHVPDPLAVVRVMARAVRPGGRIVLCDDDHDILRLYPEPAGFWPVWHAYMRTYDRLGNDPYIGRRLAALLREAGATPSRATCVFFGSVEGHPTFPVVIENMAGIIAGAREAILGGGLLDAASFDNALAALRAWQSTPGAALWYSLCWAEATR